MRSRILPVLLTLSACGGGGSPVPPGPDANSTTPALPAASIASKVACDALPAHVALPEDAVVTLCTRGKTTLGRESGTVLYTTKQAPAALLDWYKARMRSAGFHDGLVTETSYSVVPKDGLTLMVMTADAAGGSSVTLNWGHKG